MKEESRSKTGEGWTISPVSYTKASSCGPLQRALFVCIGLCIGLLNGPPRLGAQPLPGRINGIVFDSVAMRVLPNAVVLLLSADGASSFTASSDSLGRFRFNSVAAGDWAMGAQHPRLDSLGIQQLSVGATVRSGKETSVFLGVPSTQSMVSKICGADVVADSAGYLRGTVRRAESPLESLPSALHLSWVEVFLSAEGTQRSIRSVDVTSDSLGGFTACGVPAGTNIQLQAWHGADSTGLLEFVMPSNPILYRDFYVGAAERVTKPSPVSSTENTDSLPPLPMTLLRGPGRLRGVAQGREGKQIAGARLSIWSTGLETVTGPDGTFSFGALPLGSYTLDARAIGFEPQRIIIDVLPESSTVFTVAFDRLASLDTVKVRADRMKLLGRDMVEFEERRRASASGWFVGPADLEKRNPLRLVDILRTIPGVRIQIGGRGGEVAVMRGLGLQPFCTPTISIDRMRVGGPMESIEFIAPIWSVRAIEVYSSPSLTPQQFVEPLSNCGAIVIWTGPRIR